MFFGFGRLLRLLLPLELSLLFRFFINLLEPITPALKEQGEGQIANIRLAI